MGTILSVRNPVQWAYQVGKNQIEENRRLFLVALVVSTAFAAASWLYRQLERPEVVPFNRCSVSLGISRQESLTAEEVKNLEGTSRKYTPLEFTRRLLAYVQQNPTGKENTITPKAHQEWIDWMRSTSVTAAAAKKVQVSRQDRVPLTLEDEKALTFQTWALSLQPLFALVKENALPWRELLQPIQSSPRIAFTILFNCIAPIAAKAIWDGAYQQLPTKLKEVINSYLEHKGKIAALALGVLLGLYYRMNQEKGIITNLTENFANLRRTHKGLDGVDSYRKGIEDVLEKIEKLAPGKDGSNIIWYYPKHIHRTFVETIGDVLGEITATGRIGDKYPQLKNLQVLEFDLRVFLTEYCTIDDVRRGWHETVKNISKIPNALVVFKNIDVIHPFLIPSSPAQNSDEPRFSSFHGPSFENSREKFLVDLMIVALQRGKMRCLFELDENDKSKLESGNSNLMRLFHTVRSPDIQTAELENLCNEWFASSDIHFPLEKKEIAALFNRIGPFLSLNAIPPTDITDTIQEALKSRQTMENKQALQQSEQAQALKDQVLQKFWHYPEGGSSLIKALLLLDKVVVPLYRKQPEGLMSLDLTQRFQERWRRLLGPCSTEEEKRLKELPTQLKKQIRGQDAAIEAISSAVHRFRKVPRQGGKPLVLFFSGPPGVGKSQTATKLAFALNDVSC